MEARFALRVGIALSVVGVVLNFLAGLLSNGGSQAFNFLFPVAGIATLLGLLLLILALYALAKLPAMPTLVLAGAALFTLGRLGSIVLNNVLPRGSFNDPGVSLFFSALGIVSGVGTIVLFYGVYQVLAQRIGVAAPPRAPAPATAPPPAYAPKPAQPGAPARRSSFRPPQAPLPQATPRPDATKVAPKG